MHGMDSSKTIKTLKNTRQKKKYNISGTKGLSKQRRRPIKLKERYVNDAVPKTERGQKPEKLFTTVKKYKLQTERSEKNSEPKSNSLFT